MTVHRMVVKLCSEIVGLSLAERDRRIEFRRHAVNRGHIVTYNE